MRKERFDQARLINIANGLTAARILLLPLFAWLLIAGHPREAIVVFVACGVSDGLDGLLARWLHQRTLIGAYLDPIADKLLLVATLVPIYWITRHPTVLYGIPWWGSLPLWVAVLLVGREVLITVFRYEAKKLGVIIPAGREGKLKVIFQDIFIGATIAWFAWKDLLVRMRWTGWMRDLWDQFHGAFVAVNLLVAVVLTAYSLAVYLYRYRALFRAAER